ncbi:G patch domain-containing protein 3-like [Acanthaster planci]|uniref:G patch domain-containing protein 3-like n=1 Tax=Acanthaster planci TaxID=133434 RepID=A0A8B7Z924_ACAPL|nr:G patch domain-containing protein 3-like [Acanthaster planci]
MAASSSHVDDEIVFAAVTNIPSVFRSRDLRNYFSQFLEAGGFHCFHFKHRPLQNLTENEVQIEAPKETNSVPCAAICGPPHGVTTHGRQGHDGNPVDRTRDQNMRTIAGACKKKKGKNPNAAKRNQHERSCCVIRLTKSNLEKFLQMYSKKNWVDRKGSLMAELCHISRITVLDDVTDKEEPQFTPQKDTFLKSKRKPERPTPITISTTMPKSILRQLPELNPPDIMPKGNVGTPTSVYSQLIKECQFPPWLIKHLGLVFPKSQSNRRYGNVGLDYSDTVVETLVSSQMKQKKKKKKKNKRKRKDRSSSPSETKRQKTRHESSYNNQSISPPKSDEDNDSGEEWERYEALHNDVTNQERTTERLFESEMEVTWDKGSSGLVFYTDAAFWDKQEGDFDEKTADDWDVDMSGYYDPAGGDKDARDFLQMREQQRRLDGIEIVSAFKPSWNATKRQMKLDRRRAKLKVAAEKRIAEDQARPIGAFEKHTKGFGRKMMEAQGWMEGEGLGKDGNKGISTALHNEGQNSFDKRGFGYYGKQLLPDQSSNMFQDNSFTRPKKGKRAVIISTIYDDPETTDPVERLLRSQGPHSLKYRNSVNFTKSTDTGLKRLQSLTPEEKSSL